MPKTKTGHIISNKMNQTAVVSVTRFVEHPIYHKRYRVTKKFAAHNPENQYKEGETVTIAEIKPISKTKRWQIIGKIENTKQTEVNKEEKE